MSKKRGNYGSGTVIKNKSGTVTIRERYEIGGKTIRKSFTAENITKAKEKRSEYESKMRLGDTALDIYKDTLISYIKNWAELYKKKSVKSTTYDSIDYTISRISKYDIANYQLHQIDLDICQRFFNQLTDDGYSLATIQKTYNQMNNCLKKALAKGDIKNNPLLDVELPSPDEVLTEEKEMVILDDEDIEAVYKEAYKTYSTGRPKYQYGSIIVFMLYSGLRVGEAVALDLDNLDLISDTPRVSIENTASTVKNRKESVVATTKYIQKISSPKTKKSKRIVPLSKRALEAVKYALEKRAEDNSIVFQSKTGRRQNPRNINRCLESILNNADVKVKDASVHTLRHTFVSKLIRKGVNIKIISELLGHAKVSTTYNIYAHLIKNEDVKAISLLDD